MRHLEWTIRAAVGDHGEVTGGVVCIADVTEAAQLREALEDRARTDALTGCLNRAGTITALEHALADLGPNEGVALFFIDLDGFKIINDSRGHAVGDAVLEIAASRLRGALGLDDLVGRLGGDEFVVIAPGLDSTERGTRSGGHRRSAVAGSGLHRRRRISDRRQHRRGLVVDGDRERAPRRRGRGDVHRQADPLGAARAGATRQHNHVMIT